MVIITEMWQSRDVLESLRFPFWPQRVPQTKGMTSSTPIMSNVRSWCYKYRTWKTYSTSTEKLDCFSEIFNDKSYIRIEKQRQVTHRHTLYMKYGMNVLVICVFKDRKSCVYKPFESVSLSVLCGYLC